MPSSANSSNSNRPNTATINHSSTTSIQHNNNDDDDDNGGGGDDQLSGSKGADKLYGGGGDDSLVLNADNIAALSANFGAGGNAVGEAAIGGINKLAGAFNKAPVVPTREWRELYAALGEAARPLLDRQARRLDLTLGRVLQVAAQPLDHRRRRRRSRRRRPRRTTPGPTGRSPPPVAPTRTDPTPERAPGRGSPATG